MYDATMTPPVTDVNESTRAATEDAGAKSALLYHGLRRDGSARHLAAADAVG